ncbi:MAG: hypothetical protein AUH78_21315 [Gemmatimonadetes bacterium 13_1_40CM_4_69_8]|nr:MAG: hypothetical protein AUH78_21315 [Gemmatimonadetes bacterium 13_1_40CM_4_69_8]PYP71226.1 MAG: hypothetical protein DMD41_13085 [Gemmatimonadota bacterium]
MQQPIGNVQPEQWSWILSTLWSWIWAGLSWIVDWQAKVFTFILGADSFWGVVGMSLLLLLPATALVAGVWGTMISLYTLPFRLGRAGTLLQALLMSWWDALRMVWFYWAGLVRFLVVFVGWIWGLLKLGVQLVWGTLKGAVTSPLALLDATARRPGVPWPAFFLLVIWSAIEAMIFTFTLRPTMSELLADLTGYEVNAVLLVVILWVFLYVLIAGSFACIQVLNDAIKTRQVGQIVFMVLVEFTVALFEVLFLYRELVDAITPWLAQQGVQLGVVGTLGLAFFAWVGVRGMTWFLFGRFGAPALIGLLGRQAFGHEHGTGAPSGGPVGADFWQGPISALKKDTEWFKKEGREVFELMSLPILQLLAAGFNFGVVVITGRPYFSLPFRSIEDVLAATPFAGKAAAEGSR